MRKGAGTCWGAQGVARSVACELDFLQICQLLTLELYNIGLWLNTNYLAD